MRPAEAHKSITFGPRRGAGAGIIDELLNAYPCSSESLVWSTSEERPRGLEDDKEGELNYGVFTFESSWVHGDHTRLNPDNRMRAWINGPMLDRCAPLTRTHPM